MPELDRDSARGDRDQAEGARSRDSDGRSDLTPPNLESALRRRAQFDRSRQHRYSLQRIWIEEGPGVLFIMLNPSTADASQDDPTIRRCMGFAKAWGFGRLEVVNLFSWRATDPRDLKRAPEPIGPRNDRIVRAAAREAELILLAWGNHGSWRNRSADLRAMLVHHSLSCLGVTKLGEPRHPLYLSASTVPQVFSSESTL